MNYTTDFLTILLSFGEGSIDRGIEVVTLGRPIM